MDLTQIPIIVLILISCLVFALPFLGFVSERDLHNNFASSPDTLKSGEWYRLITAGFLHVDIMHLVLNMYSIYAVSPSVIGICAFLFGSKLGTAGFLIVYFVSLIMGSLFSVTRGHSTSMGASGAVYGLIGFLLVYAIKFGDMNQVSQLIFIIGINVVLAFAPGSRLDNWGHAGGFVGGIVCSFVMIGLKFFGVL